ncbi:unnamed protein product, partial [Mesorhabditis belari]|uniref:Gamma-glutamyltranspeptidase 1 n=1 Tax=Mesorhabditis belari TaxID=2138241 RepID=A0AAF3EGF7_9BILA
MSSNAGEKGVVNGSTSPSPSGGRVSPSDHFSTNINDLRKKREKSCTRTMAVLCSVLATVFLFSTIALAIVIGVQSTKGDNKEIASEYSGRRSRLDWPFPSGSLHAHYRRAAVAADHGLCSEAGRDVLMESGNAVDSMIATLLCVGVVNPQSSGLGGGFLMTLYNSSTGRCISINARETAPAAAHKNMFVTNANESSTGYRSIAVPSELHGFWTTFTRFGSGKVTWQRLFQPAIKLARNGFPVSANLALILSDKEQEILDEPTMKSIFVNSDTGRVYEEGDIMKRGRLADTLRELSEAADPIDLFYRGGFAQTIVTEIKDKGGIITLQDLANYKTDVDETPIESEELPGELAMCGPPPPSSFVITQSIIAVMAEFYAHQNVDLDDPLVYHRLIEAEKFAYAQRTKLGDIAFVQSANELVRNMTQKHYIKKIKSMITDGSHERSYYLGDNTTQPPDHGTSHVSIVDASGNAVSTTSTINLYFGSMRASPTLGIIWNDEMDDFSTPGQSNAFGFAASETNFIEPGKRPMSSMSPAVIYNKNDNQVRMVVGASGGSFIISTVAQTVIRTLLFNQTIKEAVDAPRIHNQYLPHRTDFEHSFPKVIIDKLRSQYGQTMNPVVKQKSVAQALEVLDDGFVHGNSDFRRATSTYPAGY